MVRFEKVRPRRVAETIVEQLEELVFSGRLQPGERLPGERELAERLQVSRPSLREAIGVLEAKGLLESRHGGGTFVRDVLGQSVTDPFLRLIAKRPQAAGDVLELRHALEEAAACHAAERATPEDLAAIEDALHALQAACERSPPAPDEEASADSAFLMAIAQASHNVALVHVMRSLQRVLEADIARRLEQIHRHPEDYEVIKAQHARIHREIAAGDGARARAAVREHLSFVQRGASEGRARTLAVD